MHSHIVPAKNGGQMPTLVLMSVELGKGQGKSSVTRLLLWACCADKHFLDASTSKVCNLRHRWIQRSIEFSRLHQEIA